MGQKTGTDYTNAIQTLKKLQDTFNIGGDLTRCLDYNCFEGHLHSDSDLLAQKASEDITYLCDEKNDYLLTLKNLIVKFLPDPNPKSFQTYILLIKGYLQTIKQSGWSELLQKNLNQTISKLSGELDRISGQMDESNPDGRCSECISLSQTLRQRAVHLQGYRQKCIMNRCGAFGHGNPAEGVQNRAVNLVSSIDQAAGPLSDVDQFCMGITNDFSACVKELADLKNSDPSRHPDEALSQLSQLESLWNQLKTIIEN